MSNFVVHLKYNVFIVLFFRLIEVIFIAVNSRKDLKIYPEDAIDFEGEGVKIIKTTL